MATELVALRRGDKIIPASQTDLDELLTVPAGVSFACKLWVPRSLPMQRWYRSALACVSANTEDPRWNDPTRLHVWLKIRCGLADEMGVIDGRFYCAVRSTSFSDMDQAEFKKYVDKAIQVIIAEVWPGLRLSDFLNEIDKLSGVALKRIAKEDPWDPLIIRRDMSV